MPRLSRLSIVLALPLLAACANGVPDLDFDFRPGPFNTRGEVATAPRPEPDARGLITYDTYQVAVARSGDTVADVAARIGMDAGELARFNGRAVTESLRADEVLALPRRLPGAGGTADIAAIASGAIAEAEAGAVPAGQTGASAPGGSEPVRHRVTRGETAYSVARLYNVSVRALAEWNGLGPDLAVREGQQLLIPIVLATGGSEAPTEASAPGTSVAPLPPSAATPLPDPITTAPLPSAGEAQPVPTPGPAPSAPASASARFAQPVSGPVIRPFSASNEGIDIGAPTGTPVQAAADGTVAAITQSTDQIPILVLRHPDGLLTVYANIQNIRVARGDSISRGQSVAEVGPGDPSFLHFEVRRGFDAVDPGDFLP